MDLRCNVCMVRMCDLLELNWFYGSGHLVAIARASILVPYLHYQFAAACLNIWHQLVYFCVYWYSNLQMSWRDLTSLVITALDSRVPPFERPGCIWMYVVLSRIDFVRNMFCVIKDHTCLYFVVISGFYHVKPIGPVTLTAISWITIPVPYLWTRSLKLFRGLCTPLITRFMGPTWGPSGADRTQVGPMLAPWNLLSGS